jgi:hypothetical protein
MKPLLAGLVLVVAWLALARSPLGLRVGNEVRALSDRVMLDFLRLTSEFEREL